MKKLTITILTLALLIMPATSTLATNDITQRLSGRLLLQVEGSGQIWWVNPVDKQKYEVTFANAMDLFRSHALGISNEDLSQIRINIDSLPCCIDSDNDGYNDREEVLSGHNPFGTGNLYLNPKLAKRLAGKMLLQVEDHGRVWYVDPVSLTMYEVKFATLMDLFRGLALGITDRDLEKVGEWQLYINTGEEYSFKCPTDWQFYKSKDYNGNVETWNCSKHYTQSKYSFDDGISIGFGFVANNIAEKEKNYANIKLNTVKKDVAAQEYMNNLFDGWLVIKREGARYMQVIARRYTDKGYYEFSAQGLGPTKSPEYHKIVTDQILSTFKFVDEIANWQTYTNSEYGYEIKYPQDLVVDKVNLGNISIGSQAVSYINITVYLSQQNTNFQSFVQDKLVENFGGLLDTNNIGWAEKTVLGYPALEVEFENAAGGYDGDLNWVFISKENKVYKIAALSDYDGMLQGEFQDKILSTFRFLD